MANGWARDGAVQEQIDDTVIDAVLAARARMPSGEGADECEDCGGPIPERRRSALPGVRTCVGCQSERDRKPVLGGIIGAEAKTVSFAERALALSRVSERFDPR